MTGLNFFGLTNYFSNQLPKDYAEHVGVGEKQDIRPLVEALLNNYKTGDRIIHNSKNTVFPLKFYMRRSSSNPDLIKEVNKGTSIFFSELSKNDRMYTVDYDKLYPVSFLPEEYTPTDEQIARPRRIWFVFSDFVFPKWDPDNSGILKGIQKKFKNRECHKSTNVFLYLFSKDNL